MREGESGKSQSVFFTGASRFGSAFIFSSPSTNIRGAPRLWLVSLIMVFAFTLRLCSKRSHICIFERVSLRTLIVVFLSLYLYANGIG